MINLNISEKIGKLYAKKPIRETKNDYDFLYPINSTI